MKILVTGISALELWDRGIARRAQPALSCGLSDFTPDAAVLSRITPDGFGASKPVHLLVPGGNSRPRNASWHCHFWSRPLLPGSVLQIGDGAYIASPEFCFQQLAYRLGRLDAVKLAFELCGSYSTLVPSGERYIERPPLTTAARLLEFALRAFPDTPYASAARAARWALDGAESPMECASAMLVTLPYRYGCPGFPKPELNHAVELDSAERKLLGKGKLRCDAYWSAEVAGGRPVALEYKGRDAHEGESNLRADTARENILMAHDIQVVSATASSLATEDGFSCLTAALAGALGKRLRLPPGYLDAQRATRDAVLRGGACTWVR